MPAILASAPALALSIVVALACLMLGAVGPMPKALTIALSAAAAMLAIATTRDREDTVPDTTGTGLLQLTWAYPALAALQLGLALATGDHAAPLAVQVQGAALLAGYALFFTAAVRAAGDADQRRTLLAGLVVVGLVESAYAVLNLLAGNEYLLLSRRRYYLDSATGTFVNRNNFACLLELIIPFAFLRAVQRAPGAARGREREREEGARRMMLGIGVAVMVLALAMSRSRMGLASFVAATVLVLGLDRFLAPAGAAATARRSTSVASPTAAAPNGATARDAWAARFVVAATVVLLGGVGIDIALERFSTSAGDLEAGRLPIWRDTWRMIVANPLLGTGFGTYESVNAAWRLAPDGFANNHAHSEYLEVAAETGLVGLGVVAAWLVAFGRRLVFTLRQPLDPARRDHVLAAAVGIVSLALHSTVDFGLRVPAVALVMLAVTALFLRASLAPASADSRGDQP